eukprot:1427944-Pyramimonas_sp.AAC.1
MDWFDAVIAEPVSGTCAPAGRKIDFFIVSEGLEVSSVSLHPEVPMSPRVTVSLQLASSVGRPKMRVMPVPRLFPDVRPMGCSSFDTEVMWDTVRQLMPRGQ